MAPAQVATSDLVAVVEIEIAERYQTWLPIQQVELSIRLPRGPIGMVWHERVHHDPERRFLRDLIREVTAEL